MKSKKDKWARAWAANRWWIAIFLLALTVRIAYAFLATRVDPFLRADPLHADARDYDRIAWNLVRGYGFSEYPPKPSSFRAPLYPLFLAVVYFFFGHSLLVAQMVQAVLGALACAVTVKISDKLFRRNAAVLAGVGTAFHPLLIYFGAWIITDTLFIFLLSVVILLACC